MHPSSTTLYTQFQPANGRLTLANLIQLIQRSRVYYVECLVSLSLCANFSSFFSRSINIINCYKMLPFVYLISSRLGTLMTTDKVFTLALYIIFYPNYSDCFGTISIQLNVLLLPHFFVPDTVQGSMGGNQGLWLHPGWALHSNCWSQACWPGEQWGQFNCFLS